LWEGLEWRREEGDDKKRRLKLAGRRLVPLPGSLRPKHPIFSPDAKGVSHVAFCSALPDMASGPQYSELLALQIT
jgi:hypothetical protein